MKTLSKVAVGALAAGFVPVTGCTKVQEPAPATARNVDSTVPTAAMTPAARTRSAAEQIAQARCEREEKCGNVGKDQTFSSSQDCLVRIQNDWKEELNARECPGGINDKELGDCLAQVRAEACSNPFDTLARVAACTAGQICVEQR